MKGKFFPPSAVGNITDGRGGEWLEFGGEPLNQFYCASQLKHNQMEGHLRFSIGGLLGFGDIRWNDIRRETLDEDAQKAVQLWGAMRYILTEIINQAESNSARQP